MRVARGLGIALLVWSATAIAGKPAPISPIVQVTNNYRDTGPAINDDGEVVYYRDGVVYSTTRGTIVGPVPWGIDASNLGISNSGEVVYAAGSEQNYSFIHSTVRGLLFPQAAYGPTISPTTGEVGFLLQLGWQGNTTSSFATTLQGIVETFDRGLYSVGVGDVNDYGEVVFELADLGAPQPLNRWRVYSVHRGFLTPVGVTAVQPSINNNGEVVYSGFDSYGRQQIFSTERGQLTSFDNPADIVETADLPDINSSGVIVFRGRVNGVDGLYLYDASRVKGPKGSRPPKPPKPPK